METCALLHMCTLTRLSTLSSVWLEFFFSDTKNELWFSSTNPQDSRYYVLNAEDDDTLLIGVYYMQSWRLDVYVGNTYIAPKNHGTNADGEVSAVSKISLNRMKKTVKKHDCVLS